MGVSRVALKRRLSWPPPPPRTDRACVAVTTARAETAAPTANRGYRNVSVYRHTNAHRDSHWRERRNGANGTRSERRDPFFLSFFSLYSRYRTSGLFEPNRRTRQAHCGARPDNRDVACWHPRVLKCLIYKTTATAKTTTTTTATITTAAERTDWFSQNEDRAKRERQRRCYKKGASRKTTEAHRLFAPAERKTSLAARKRPRKRGEPKINAVVALELLLLLSLLSRACLVFAHRWSTCKISVLAALSSLALLRAVEDEKWKQLPSNVEKKRRSLLVLSQLVPPTPRRKANKLKTSWSFPFYSVGSIFLLYLTFRWFFRSEITKLL